MRPTAETVNDGDDLRRRLQPRGEVDRAGDALVFFDPDVGLRPGLVARLAHRQREGAPTPSHVHGGLARRNRHRVDGHAAAAQHQGGARRDVGAGDGILHRDLQRRPDERKEAGVRVVHPLARGHREQRGGGEQCFLHWRPPFQDWSRQTLGPRLQPRGDVHRAGAALALFDLHARLRPRLVAGLADREGEGAGAVHAHAHGGHDRGSLHGVDVRALAEHQGGAGGDVRAGDGILHGDVHRRRDVGGADNGVGDPGAAGQREEGGDGEQRDLHRRSILRMGGAIRFSASQRASPGRSDTGRRRARRPFRAPERIARPIAPTARPRERTATPQRISRSPYLVLAVALALTLPASLVVLASANGRDRARFDNAVQSTLDRVRGRLETHVALLLGGAGLFDASDSVTRQDFATYVRRLDVHRAYPGVLGVGFARVLHPGDDSAIAAGARREGAAGFHVWPVSGDSVRTTILFLEPSTTGNGAALGFDMSSEPVRRTAMQRARDTGVSAMSGRVLLRQEIDPRGRPGFLIYVPVYRHGMPLATVEERRRALQGFVFAPFRAEDLLQEVFGSEQVPGVDFEIYDGWRAAPELLLFDTHPGTVWRALYRRTLRMRVGGRTLTLRFESRPEFEAGLVGSLVPWIALLGLAVSAVLFLIARAQARARADAELRAEALRVALAERERLVQIVESSSDLVGFASPDGALLYLNDAGRRMVGLERERMGGARTLDELFTPDEAGRFAAEALPAVRAAGRWRGETRLRHLVTGDTVPVQCNLFRIPDPQTGETIGLGTVTRDVTAEKRAQEAIEEARRAAEASAGRSRELAARLRTQAMELERQVDQAQALND